MSAHPTEGDPWRAEISARRRPCWPSSCSAFPLVPVAAGASTFDDGFNRARIRRPRARLAGGRRRISISGNQLSSAPRRSCSSWQSCRPSAAPTSPCGAGFATASSNSSPRFGVVAPLPGRAELLPGLPPGRWNGVPCKSSKVVAGTETVLKSLAVANPASNTVSSPRGPGDRDGALPQARRRAQADGRRRHVLGRQRRDRPREPRHSGQRASRGRLRRLGADGTTALTLTLGATPGNVPVSGSADDQLEHHWRQRLRVHVRAERRAARVREREAGPLTSTHDLRHDLRVGLGGQRLEERDRDRGSATGLTLTLGLRPPTFHRTERRRSAGAPPGPATAASPPGSAGHAPFPERGHGRLTYHDELRHDVHVGLWWQRLEERDRDRRLSAGCPPDRGPGPRDCDDGPSALGPLLRVPRPQRGASPGGPAEHQPRTAICCR